MWAWFGKSNRARPQEAQASAPAAPDLRGAVQTIARQASSLGRNAAEVRGLIDETGADAVFMNRLFEPDAFARDADIAHGLKADGVECRGFNGSLLARPGAVLNGSDAPYKVFTPFMKALLAAAEPPPPSPAPRRVDTPETVQTEAVDDWRLHPTRPDWSQGFDWTPGHVVIPELNNIDRMATIAAVLDRAGMRARDIDRVMGGNWQRVLTDVLG